MNKQTDFDMGMDMSADEMISKARTASGYLKALSNETRLSLLCHLVPQSRTVGELEQLVGVPQANVSQHLARLRADGLVNSIRVGKTIEYSIADEDAMSILKILHQKYCSVG